MWSLLLATSLVPTTVHAFALLPPCSTRALFAAPIRRSVTTAVSAGNRARFGVAPIGTAGYGGYCGSAGSVVGHALHMSTTSSTPSTTTNTNTKSTPTPTPIILLGGFLGAGKTTTLKHLLENTQGTQLGVIVNDVASVNIDAKLMSGRAEDGVVEMQNGCACCTLAEELLTSVETLLYNRNFDALVVELSGVADPMAIQGNWEQAAAQGHPVALQAKIAKTVTLIDGSTFGSDWMTQDLAADRPGWTEPGDDCAGQQAVSELMADQVESADIVLINKVDIAGDNAKVATALVQSLNEDARVELVQYGKVSPHLLLQGSAAAAATTTPSSKNDAPVECDDKSCQDPTHAHAHSCTDTHCTDPSHNHDHHTHHTHHTQQSQDHADSCTDAHCTDPSHNHNHSHGHSHDHTHNTSTDALAISSFVYKRSRPFDAAKLMDLLGKWPVPVKNTLDVAFLQKVVEGNDNVTMQGQVQEKTSPFVGVLRSKGFCWFAPDTWDPNQDAWRHETAMYWSHAGKQIGISASGRWWHTIPLEQMREVLQSNPQEYDRILKEDFVTEEFGDRRQEIVFIGMGLNEKKISDALDQCLLADEQLDEYRARAAQAVPVTNA
eukprot:Nitzschia sp. Nitz4//scaffold17_size182527//135333//137153//NITZ4_001874-RA/size182527-processed-gene-0.69-mRNA-1//-1//CDS//3329539400//6016//frame0